MTPCCRKQEHWAASLYISLLTQFMLKFSKETWDQDNILCVAIQIQELNK